MSNNTKGRIYNNITETVGRTPMVRLSKFEKEINTKCEIITRSVRNGLNCHKAIQNMFWSFKKPQEE